jgi:hypothetical protein
VKKKIFNWIKKKYSMEKVATHVDNVHKKDFIKDPENYEYPVAESK